MMDNMSFEQMLQRLEQIVRTMEQGNVALDESLKLFQEGTALVRSCESVLDKAQMQVTQITADAAGNPIEETFPQQIEE